MRKIILFFVLLIILFFNSDVYAVCDTADINRLKEIASYVEVTYEHNVYSVYDEEIDDYIRTSVYDIMVSGLTDEIYIMSDGGKSYHYNALQNGMVNISASSGERKLFLFSEVCSGVVLDTRVLNLPYFNFNSMSEECKKTEFQDLDICVEFVEKKDDQITFGEFEDEMEKIKEERAGIFYKIKKIIFNNLWLFLGILICLIIGIIALILTYRKRSVLE